jgi:flagellar hook-basal body complex protein FliE
MTVGVTGALNAYRMAIDRLADTPGNSASATPASGSGGDFASMVKNMADGAVKVGQVAEQQTAAAAAGKADLNSVVMAVSEAELTLNTVVAVRDKVIDAYREILRMPI